MNLCRTCGEDFGGVEVFDAHRVGNHEYLFSESQPDGRRCLSVVEMETKGWIKNSRGRWSNSRLLIDGKKPWEAP